MDGWNFIRAPESDIDDDAGDSLDAAEELVAIMEEFQATHNDPVVIVFDSSSGHLGLAFRGNEKLKVVAARDADDYIKRYIDKAPERERRNIRVVSSDNDVYYYAKSSYATPLKCGEFWKKLRRNDVQGGRGSFR